MPGRCPSCNQIYTDDSLSFCPNDGTPLSKEAPAAYDPQTLVGPPPPPYQPQQQGYYPPSGGQIPPPSDQAPPPGWQPPPYGQQPPPYGQQQPPYGEQQQYAPQYGGGGGKSKMPIIIALAAVVLIGGGIGLYFMLRDNSSTSSNIDVNVNNTSNTSRSTTTVPTIPTPGTTYPTPPTTTSTSTTRGSYSEDEKHRLFQAVGITRDNALIVEVAEKIGVSDSSGNPNSEFESFAKEHMNWAMRNVSWVQEHTDPQKARAYVMANK